MNSPRRAVTPPRRSLAPVGQPARARGWFIGDRAEPRHRNLWLLAAFIALGVTISVHLFDLQVVRGPALAELAASQHDSSITIDGERGDILDDQGHILASNVTVYDIYADPALIPSAERVSVAQQVGAVLHLGPSLIEQDLALPTQFVYLSKQVSSATEQTVADLGLDGIGAIASEERVYNSSPIASESFDEPELGFVNANGQGSYGVEQYYNQQLSGTNGSESTVVDDDGNSIQLSNQADVPAQNGDNLELGLDSQVQYWAEQAIAEGVVHTKSSQGEVIVLDTKTGLIRAEAQYPSYNANDYATTPVSDFVDQSIGDLYEPGSIMKVVTFAGGLNTHAITPTYTFDEGPVTIDGITIHDWDFKAHGWITMRYVLDESLNDGAIKVGELEGHNAFYENLLAFGIGSPTGVDLSGEQNVPLTPQSTWTALDYAENTFGQEEEVSPIDMVAAVNAVANGGVWIQPHAVNKIIDPNTGKVTTVVPTTRRVISVAADNTLKGLMVDVVQDPGAEGWLAAIPQFKNQDAGKTGTADEPTNGTYQGALVVSYAGFLPASNPEFTMIVVLWYPKETYVAKFGSELAAPIWKQLAQVIIDQWHITP